MKRHPDLAARTGKKVRFGDARVNGEDSDEGDFDDTELLEERKQRRGGVKLEGYDNASSGSEGEEDAGIESGDEADEADGANRPPPLHSGDAASAVAANDDNNNNDEDEDMDMFAEAEPTPTAKKAKRGQSTRVSNGDDDEDVDGQDYASFDRFDPDAGEMRIEAFNMRAEMEEGSFDETGQYVQNKLDPHRFHDSWLENVSEEEMLMAREAHRRREQAEERQQAEEAREMRDRAGLVRVAQLELLELLQPGETVTAALRRLGGGGGAGQRLTRRRGGKSGPAPPLSAEALARRQEVERLTSLCSQLMGFGQLDVYEWTREQIEAQLQRDGPVHAVSEFTMAATQPVVVNSAAQWEFKWSAEDTAAVHGPHTTAEMQAWHAHGYFNQPTLLVRQIGHDQFTTLSEAGFV